jgi:hypothetical protein
MQGLSQTTIQWFMQASKRLAGNALKAWFAESLTRGAARPLFRLLVCSNSGP